MAHTDSVVCIYLCMSVPAQVISVHMPLYVKCAGRVSSVGCFKRKGSEVQLPDREEQAKQIEERSEATSSLLSPSCVPSSSSTSSSSAPAASLLVGGKGWKRAVLVLTTFNLI